MQDPAGLEASSADKHTVSPAVSAWLRDLIGLGRHCDKRSSVGSASSRNTFTAPPI